MSEQNKEMAMMKSTPTGALTETASNAASATAMAAVQARYVMAIQRPRNPADVREAMIKECKRTRFAERARYHKPIGKGIEGPSIRFAEMAIRVMTNIYTETPTLYDDEKKRVIRVTVMDLETNVTYSKDVTIAKTVERRSKPKEKPLGTRHNAHGDLLYIIAATDDDILNKENALISKALRTCVLRLVPGEIMDECMEEVVATLSKDVLQDPKAEQKKIADSFSVMNVTPSILEGFLGNKIGQASNDQIIMLKAMYAALRDGEITVADILNESSAETGGEKPDDAGKTSGIKDKLQKRAAKIKAAEKHASEQKSTQNNGPPPDQGELPDQEDQKYYVDENGDHIPM